MQKQLRGLVTLITLLDYAISVAENSVRRSLSSFRDFNQVYTLHDLERSFVFWMSAMFYALFN